MVKPKIYDCFMFFNELEVLDIRMDIMNDYVDYFVLVESDFTHSNKPKKLSFKENKHKFDCSKIIHVVLNSFMLSEPWVNENHQRNYIMKGLKGANPDDIVIVSDVDEIPNPKILIDNLHRLEEVEVFSLKLKTFYYYVNCLQNQIWCAPTVTKFKNLLFPQDLRYRRFENLFGKDGEGGWHYGYIGGEERIRSKIKGFAHQELNREEFISEDNIKRCLKTGEDIFNRKSKIFERKFVDLEGNSPDCIHKFIKKYPYIVR